MDGQIELVGVDGVEGILGLARFSVFRAWS